MTPDRSSISDKFSGQPKRVRVGVVVASPLLALGLMSILEETVGAEAVAMKLGKVTTAKELAAVIVDGRCAVEELCAVVTRLRHEVPLLKIVAVGWPRPVEEVQRIVGAGAKGYLLEGAGEAEICMAIEVVLDGSIWAPRKVLAKLIDENTALSAEGAQEAATDELSAREWDVMNLLAGGHSNREIAVAMGIEPATVKAHLGRMLRKTRSKNRLEMTLRSLQQRRGDASESGA